MKYYVAVAIACAVAAVVITIAGCTVLHRPQTQPTPQQQTAAEAAMKGHSKAAVMIRCYMGHIQGIVILANGPGVFQLPIDKYVCDGNDRT
jgi:hypothetical protein